MVLDTDAEDNVLFINVTTTLHTAPVFILKAFIYIINISQLRQPLYTEYWAVNI